jgi:hypothetical protein
MSTRADIRNGVRDKLSAWPLLTTTLNGAITATATSLALTSGTGLAERMMLEIESEVIRVSAFSGATISEAIRADRGSTGATHADLVAVNGYPFWGWTNLHLNRVINKAIDWMGEGMVYTLNPVENTWLANFKEFGLPSGCTYPYGNIVKKVELWDENSGNSGGYKEILGWRHQGDRIFLNSELTQDTDVRLWIQQKQANLSADNTALDDSRYLECIESYTTGRCLDELLANRTRYYEYSASLNDRASTPDELQRSSYYFFNQATILRDQISRPGLSGFASIQRPQDG